MRKSQTPYVVFYSAPVRWAENENCCLMADDPGNEVRRISIRVQDSALPLRI